MSKKYFIRINDQFIRFDKIKEIEVLKYFKTDSMAIIKILFIDSFNSTEICLKTPEWMPVKECSEYLNPRITEVVSFIEKAINGNLNEYSIEFE